MPQKLSILPGIRPIVGRDEAEVESRYRQAVELVTIEDAIVALGRPFNDHDFSQYPLDAPFPELGDLGSNSQKGGSDRIKQLARDEGLTLREVALRFSRPRRDFVGTPEQVADALQTWFEQGAADGFIINSLLPDGLQYFTELVVPVLQQRLFRDEYSGTLRDNLGLQRPTVTRPPSKRKARHWHERIPQPPVGEPACRTRGDLGAGGPASQYRSTPAPGRTTAGANTLATRHLTRA